MVDPEAPELDPDREVLIAAFKKTLHHLDIASAALSPNSGTPNASADKVAKKSSPLDSPEGKLPTGFVKTDDGLVLVHNLCGARLPIPEGTETYGVSQIAWAHRCGQS